MAPDKGFRATGSGYHIPGYRGPASWKRGLGDPYVDYITTVAKQGLAPTMHYITAIRHILTARVRDTPLHKETATSNALVLFTY